VGISQITLGYGFAHANAAIDSSLLIQGAKVNLNVGILDYTRAVSFFHRFAWVEASVPIASLNGAVTGTTVRGSVTGAGDSSYVFGTPLRVGQPSACRNFLPTTLRPPSA
jgi:hypothetical protein